jgi:hypothetical protein
VGRWGSNQDQEGQQQAEGPEKSEFQKYRSLGLSVLCKEATAAGARVKQGRNTAMKRLTAICAITGLLLGETAGADRIDLTRFTCKQFLEMNRDDALIVVGWLRPFSSQLGTDQRGKNFCA